MAKSKSKYIQLSASKLSVLEECPRCFWLQMNAKKRDGKAFRRPSGAFPSLPRGIDSVLKKYFDLYRQDGSMPPEFQAHLPGRLFDDQESLTLWREWRTGLKYIDEGLGVEVVSAFDDLLVNDVLQEAEPGMGDPESIRVYIPFDYKTKNGEPKTNGAEFYQTQLNCYELCLKSNGHETCGKGVLAYVYPEDLEREDSEGELRRVVPLNFGIKVFELPTSIDDAMALIERAAKICRGPIPDPDPKCEFCNYVANYADAVVKAEEEAEEALKAKEYEEKHNGCGH